MYRNPGNPINRRASRPLRALIGPARPDGPPPQPRWRDDPGPRRLQLSVRRPAPARGLPAPGATCRASSLACPKCRPQARSGVGRRWRHALRAPQPDPVAIRANEPPECPQVIEVPKRKRSLILQSAPLLAYILDFPFRNRAKRRSVQSAAYLRD